MAPEFDVEGRRLKLSNLDKVLYPVPGFTKGEVIDYYTRVAPALLPHLRGRALTLKRYPNGVDGKYFYEKQKPSHAPDWVKSRTIETGDRDIDFVICDDLPTLVWLANLADIEMHPSLALAKDSDRPTVLAFDLDPGEPAALPECREVALLLRDTLADLGLDCRAKTSGSKGMQVYVPLNTPVTYDDTKPFAQALAQLMERHHPKLIVSSMKKSLRGGKVFIDWSQNDDAKTTITPYSLRGLDRPFVAAPRTWDELLAVARAHPGGIGMKGALYEGLTCDVLPFVWAAGGGAVDFDDPGARAAFKLFAQLAP
ncbi:MAG: non-homologous end-joining DNA ligase, partial [Actinomycetota bacterium]|nr:non-homologous end-joining DNA ligase [Actinomycetota bacterium]